MAELMVELVQYVQERLESINSRLVTRLDYAVFNQASWWRSQTG
jgi:hypothetical protein